MVYRANTGSSVQHFYVGDWRLCPITVQQLMFAYYELRWMIKPTTIFLEPSPNLPNLMSTTPEPYFTDHGYNLSSASTSSRAHIL